MDYRTFPCPACGEMIDTTMAACRYCGAAIDAGAAQAAADVQQRVQQACGEASSLRTTATSIPLLFLFSYAPFIGGFATVGSLALIVLVPALAIRWHRRFASLAAGDPDLRRARSGVKTAMVIWGVMLPVLAVFYGLRLIGALRYLPAFR